MADNKRPIGYSPNKQAVALAASFMVILGGMMTTIMLAVGSGADILPSVLASIGFFGLIALVPASMLRPYKAAEFNEPHKESLWSIIKGWFQSEPEDTTVIRPWKRKETDFVPQPHGTDYANCFVEDRREPNE